MGMYCRYLTAAIETLPSLPSGERVTVRATGTDGGIVLPSCLLESVASECTATHPKTSAKPQRSAQRKPLKNKVQTLFRRGKTAERSGFEPEMPVSRHTGLAIRRFRPLSHLSDAERISPSSGPGGVVAKQARGTASARLYSMDLESKSIRIKPFAP